MLIDPDQGPNSQVIYARLTLRLVLAMTVHLYYHLNESILLSCY